jgi:hypothetical protein
MNEISSNELQQGTGRQHFPLSMEPNCYFVSCHYAWITDVLHKIELLFQSSSNHCGQKCYSDPFKSFKPTFILVESKKQQSTRKYVFKIMEGKDIPGISYVVTNFFFWR